jgi:hypothetical protein
MKAVSIAGPQFYTQIIFTWGGLKKQAEKGHGRKRYEETQLHREDVTALKW